MSARDPAPRPGAARFPRRSARLTDIPLRRPGGWLPTCVAAALLVGGCARNRGPTGSIAVGGHEASGPVSARAALIFESEPDATGARLGYVDVLAGFEPVTCELFRHHVRHGGPPEGSRFRGFMVLLFVRQDATGKWLPPKGPGRFVPESAAAADAPSFLAYAHHPDALLPLDAFDRGEGEVVVDVLDPVPGGRIVGRVAARAPGGGAGTKWSVRGHFSAEFCDLQGATPP